MEWTVPIQKLEVSKVKVGFIQKNLKPITPLSYTDGPISFQNLNILLPPLQIRDYDPTSGKLMLSLPEGSQTSSKLQALQDALLSSVFVNQRYWFPQSNRTMEQIRGAFQPFLDNGVLYLYCPCFPSLPRSEGAGPCFPSSSLTRGDGENTLQNHDRRNLLCIWKENEWKQFDTTGLLQRGESIRVALRLQGISFQTNLSTGVWTGRFRVQHRIACIYHCGTPKKVFVEPQH